MTPLRPLSYPLSAALLAAASTLLEPAPVAAQTIEAVRVEGAGPRLDGRLDDPVWRRAPAASGFVHREPTEGVPAPEDTEVRFAYDDDALWIGARMYADDPSRVAALVTRRDRDDSAEQLIVSLDTYHDRRTAYTFAVTPAGVRIDYYHSDDFEGRRDYGFDPVWQVETAIDSAGWTAEIRIPFTQLRFTEPGAPSQRVAQAGNPGEAAAATGDGQSAEKAGGDTAAAADGMVWGVNLVRRVPARNEVSYWVLVRRNETGWASRMGTLTGLREIRPSRRIEAMPYIAADATFTDAVDSRDPFAQSRATAFRAGGDLKIGIGPNLTLDATFNPDFGQVEADPAEVNLSAFETFFGEKRPFFTEGSQLFGGRGLFYSRRIGAPPPGDADADYAEEIDNTTILGAAKLTGRLPSGLSIGAIAAVTGVERVETYDTLAAEYGSVAVAPRTAYAVASVRQELGASSSTVGAMLTAVQRDLEPGTPLADLVTRSAYSGIVDGRIRWAGGKYDVSAYLGFTHVRGDSSAILRLQRSSSRYWQRPDATHVALESDRRTMTGTMLGINHSKMAGRHWLWDIDYWQEAPGLEANDIGAFGSVDDRGVVTSLRYRETEPGRWLRNYSVGLFHATEWNFGGVRRFTVIEPYLDVTLPNFWSVELAADFETRGLSDDLTRGGPLMGTGRAWGVSGEIRNSDGARTEWGIDLGIDGDELGGWSYELEGDISFRPGDRWELSLDPSWTRGENPRQYITSRDGGRDATFGRRYIFAHVDRAEVAMRVRLNYTFTPDLTLESYVEPFASSGTFHTFGELEASRSREVIVYGTRGTSVVEADDGSRTVTADGETYTISSRDFNIRSLRSNLVLRWEWRPGSTAYLVWQQDRFASRDPGAVEPAALWDAFRARGDQFLALKLSYWLPLR